MIPKLLLPTFTYIYTHLRTFTHICIHLHTFTYIYTHLHTFTHIYTHLHTFTHIYTHLHTFTHIYTHLHPFTHIYIHLHNHAAWLKNLYLLCLCLSSRPIVYLRRQEVSSLPSGQKKKKQAWSVMRKKCLIHIKSLYLSATQILFLVFDSLPLGFILSHLNPTF